MFLSLRTHSSYWLLLSNSSLRLVYYYIINIIIGRFFYQIKNEDCKIRKKVLFSLCSTVFVLFRNFSYFDVSFANFPLVKKVRCLFMLWSRSGFAICIYVVNIYSVKFVWRKLYQKYFFKKIKNVVLKIKFMF